MRVAKLWRLFFLVGIALFLACECQQASPQSAQRSQADTEQRVDALLAKMTLDEKLTLIGGINDFYIQGIPRLGLPALRMSDGPLGVHDYGATTAYPAAIALAASWDTDLARRVGESMGKDARARGVHFILAPGMNIYRAPMNGRNFEYLGEDPYLAASGCLTRGGDSGARCDCHSQALRGKQSGIRTHGS
jgi:beta-glucosidase